MMAYYDDNIYYVENQMDFDFIKFLIVNFNFN